LAFNSFVFLLFAPLALLGHFYLRGRIRLLFLTVASYVFYGWANPWCISLLFASSFLDYAVGRALGNTDDRRRRNQLLACSLIGNLGLLAAFKYTGFFTRAINDALQAAGSDFAFPVPNIFLPVGISFYTFQTLSYTIDVWRREMQPEKRFLVFSLYVAYFPQLVAGPIERGASLMPQLGRERVPLARQDALDGVTRIIWGLTKKVVFADWLAVYVNDVFGRVDRAEPWELFLAVNAFAFQIYLDFSAYSDIALGLARIMGVKLMENFRWPYLAQNIGEFWRRWHISLSTWLRDYLYIPLGGSRHGTGRTFLNFMIVMFLGGLWHGANYTYVSWGMWIGLALVLHRLWSLSLGPKVDAVLPATVARAGGVLLTYFTMLGAWVLFRVSSMDEARDYFCGLFADQQPGTRASWDESSRRTAWLLGVSMIAHILRGSGLLRAPGRPSAPWIYGLLWGGLVTLMALAHAPVGAKFIYFQF
jgi:D-alanyl-lipoteichoic acid acyltransferase DltB (MBOAT superfamily)